ncbi:MAG: hypothetical protein MRQ13_04895 [Candidatus Midichloria sp.]|nr:hypothetical protein [Candidatus Midichloria sp.]
MESLQQLVNRYSSNKEYFLGENRKRANTQEKTSSKDQGPQEQQQGPKPELASLVSTVS